MKTKKLPSHRKVLERVLEANSISCLMAWAAMGQEYTSSKDSDAPVGADFTNAARVVSRLLYDVCGDLERLAIRYEHEQGQEVDA